MSARVTGSHSVWNVWMPRVSLVSAVVLILLLSVAYLLGPFGSLGMGLAAVLVGVLGFFWAMSQRRVGLAVANLGVGLFGIPAFVVLVTLVGGP